MNRPSAVVDPVWRIVLDRAREDGDLGYAEFVCRWPLDYYRERARQIGFQGFERVLDVGSGFGQWSLALAGDNREVCAVDRHPQRAATSNALFRSVRAENATACVGSATALPFPGQSFDALVCYGVFMFLDRTIALSEFRRVLRPGGLLYICTNARGWWLKLAIENALGSRSRARTGWSSYRHGRSGAVPNATDIADVADVLKAEGPWCDVRAGAEGTLGLAQPRVAATYTAKYLGFDNVIEFRARKPEESPAGASRKRDTNTLLFHKLGLALEQSDYAYERELARYSTPIDYHDETRSTCPDAVAFAAGVARGCNRTTALRRIFELATREARTTETKIVACITLAQKLFYHHFAFQPMIDRDRLLLDPIGSVLFGACRCGNVARFLVDLFVVNGLEARLLGSACHTSAEVECRGRWVLAEANLFPPGVTPRNPAGDLVGIDDIVADPARLDHAPSYVNYEAGHIGAFRTLYPDAYAPIANWLTNPLLPSVAFLGKEFGEEGRGGVIRRWRKGGDAASWEADPDYGWYYLEAVGEVQGFALTTVQRPQQVRDVDRHGLRLRWEPPQPGTAAILSYEIVTAHRPRGWSYENLPVGFDFCDERPFTTVQACEFELDGSFADRPAYITIRVKSSPGDPSFVLPSREIVLMPEYPFAAA